jgi:hypothetical protein
MFREQRFAAEAARLSFAGITSFAGDNGHRQPCGIALSASRVDHRLRPRYAIQALVCRQFAPVWPRSVPFLTTKQRQSG